MIAAPRRRHRPADERRRLEALERLAAAAFDFRQARPRPSPLPCFTDDEWGRYAGATRDADAMRRACFDCTARYQAEQQRADRCYPPDGAVTPAERLSAGTYGADEPISLRRATDAAQSPRARRVPRRAWTVERSGPDLPDLSRAKAANG